MRQGNGLSNLTLNIKLKNMSAVKTQFQEELEKENQFNLEEMEYESQQNLSHTDMLEEIENQERDYGEEREDTRDPDEMRENYLSGVNYI